MNTIESRRWLRGVLTAIPLAVGLMAAGSATAEPAATATESLSVPVGSHKLLRLPTAVGRIAIGDPKVADINVVNGRELLLLGKAPGVTSLLIWPRTAKKKGTSPMPVEYTVTVGGLAGQDNDSALRNVFVTPGVGITGSTPDLMSHQRAVQAAATSDKALVNDSSFVAGDTQVMSEVKVVEVERTTAQRYGLNILGSFGRGSNPIQGGAFANGTLSGISNVSTNTGGTATSSTTVGSSGLQALSSTGFVPLSNAFNFVFGNNYFTSVLSVLENKGLARTLAEPSLTAMSGQTATFLAGGEFPVPVPQSSGGSGTATVTIQYKEFGVRLNLTPTVLSPSRIAMKIAPEVSELDYSNGVNLNGYTIPGLIVRRTDTLVELGDGETFVLSGLVSNTMKASVDKVPLLGDLPVIGAFFKSNTYSRDEKELIMIVTPHLVRPFARNAPLPSLPGAHIDGYQPNFADTMFFERGNFGQGDHGYSR